PCPSHSSSQPRPQFAAPDYFSQSRPVLPGPPTPANRVPDLPPRSPAPSPDLPSLRPATSILRAAYFPAFVVRASAGALAAPPPEFPFRPLVPCFPIAAR